MSFTFNTNGRKNWWDMTGTLQRPGQNIPTYGQYTPYNQHTLSTYHQHNMPTYGQHGGMQPITRLPTTIIRQGCGCGK